ncbi:LOW QUALITY PROTEIN: ras association domain-containing protein 5 [Centropristis striata]|uniref:LOW QUALITY PROTEIN: ras association domain-containing protein 5 n=1 Tax=Centropristis striata TaxID=184440 RepID=UPI0027E146C3|nr:LOW QUALITY PROTEIN: ras association domain-containing protein 5 [Centropristis striata]
MFNVVHQARKYVPTRSSVTDDSLLTVRTVHVNKSPGTLKEAPEATWPPPGAKMRISKANKGAVVVRAVRRHPSPQPASLESLEAAWSERGAPGVTSPGNGELGAAGNGMEGPGGGPPRGRKKGFRPPDVRTIFTPGEKDPRVRQESGEGHTFLPGGENTWCDVCCHYIFQHGLTCAGCKYTCHAACRDRVSLDCHPAGSPVSPDQLNNNTPPHDVEKERELRTEFSRDEIRQKIEQYNTLTRDHLKMTLSATGVYTGFIKVQMDLRRPVTVRGGQRGAGGALVEEAFYLPRGVTNTLHISSHNTVRQVIVALLNKFTVADNPAKYALYKRYRREEQVYVCKLADGEQPLFLRLVAGPDTDTLSFVLREQQTGEVMWDAFSIPELRNFLRILDKEEDEQKVAVIRRYESYRQRLQEALREVRGHS